MPPSEGGGSIKVESNSQDVGITVSFNPHGETITLGAGSSVYQTALDRNLRFDEGVQRAFEQANPHIDDLSKVAAGETVNIPSAEQIQTARENIAQEPLADGSIGDDYFESEVDGLQNEANEQFNSLSVEDQDLQRRLDNDPRFHTASLDGVVLGDSPIKPSLDEY